MVILWDESGVQRDRGRGGARLQQWDSLGNGLETSAVTGDTSASPPVKKR
jgi:hypothetical protein